MADLASYEMMFGRTTYHGGGNWFSLTGKWGGEASTGRVQVRVGGGELGGSTRIERSERGWGMRNEDGVLGEATALSDVLSSLPDVPMTSHAGWIDAGSADMTTVPNECPVRCRVEARIFLVCCGKAKNKAKSKRQFDTEVAKCKETINDDGCPVPPCPKNECKFPDSGGEAGAPVPGDKKGETPIVSDTTGGGRPDKPWKHASYRGVDSCLEWAYNFDEAAENSDDYADFNKRMLTWAQSPSFTHERPMRTDGYNEASQANGSDNAAHYAGAMAAGSEQVEVQYHKDKQEYDKAKSDEERNEKEAEMYADRAGQEVFDELWNCLVSENPFFPGISDEAWKRCRHLVGQGFYDFFCKRWG